MRNGLIYPFNEFKLSSDSLEKVAKVAYFKWINGSNDDKLNWLEAEKEVFLNTLNGDNDG